MSVGEKEVSIFQNGRSRAVRIPAGFDLPGDSATIWQTDDGIIHLRPIRPKMTLVEVLDWLAEQEPFDEKMLEVDDPPPEAIDLDGR